MGVGLRRAEDGTPFWQAEELVKLKLEIQELSQAHLKLNPNGSQ